MKTRKIFLFIAAAMTVTWGLFPVGAATPGWLPEELRGKDIYRNGVSPSGGNIRAVVADGSTEVAGSLMPCANCHGLDGRGRPEGGIVPSRLLWNDLTRPYDIPAEGGRRRGAYDARLLVRAITLGIDAAGNRLNRAMPRYSLSRADAGDLVAYLRKIDADHDPGVLPDSITVAVVLPPATKFPALGAAIRSVLTADLQKVNQAGGIYGRRLDVVFREATDRPSGIPSAFEELARSETTFALLSSFVAGAEEAVSDVLRNSKLPLVGAWTLRPPKDADDNAYVFYSDAGVTGQAESLAANALSKPGVKTVLISSDDELSRTAANALKARLPAPIEELASPTKIGEADTLVRRLKAAGTTHVYLFVRRSERLTIVDAAARANWEAKFLIPGGLAGLASSDLRALPANAVLAVAFLPTDVTPEASAEYEKLAREYSLPRDQVAAQLRALSELRVLVEGLKRAGGDLTRERFIHALEGLYEFQPGFSRPVSFGPHRRIGAVGFHLISPPRP